MIAAAAALGACASEGVVGSLKGEPGAAAPGVEPGPTDPGSPVSIKPSDAAISAGGASTCVKTSSEEARCWGENGTGSLGIGDTDPSMSRDPVAPSPLGRVKALFSGERSHCALRTGGKLYCWGDMFVRIVGVPQETDHLPITTPFSVDDIIGDVARVAIGRFFMCTLTVGGEVRCFGKNDRGQLGLGSKDDQPLPTTVKGLDGPATSLSASMGGLFACATTNQGSVYCWGDNTSGEIGQGGGPVLEPRKIAGLPERAVEVAAGGAHACARLTSGKVACWGQGASGQLGDGLGASNVSPVLAESLTDVVALAAGRAHTCAVRSEGSVFCWGDDSAGQAGAIPESKRPWVVLPSNFVARYVSCGLAHTCAWGDGGRVRCWGSDTSAQLGPKTATF